MPCKHLDRLLPPMQARGKQSLEVREAIKKSNITEEAILDAVEYERQAVKLEKCLSKIGIESFRAELLMDRFVDNLTLREIATLRGYLNHKVVLKLLNDTVSRLKLLDVSVVRNLLKEYN